MSTVSNIEKKIIKVQQELLDLNAKLEEVKQQSPDQRLAVEMHSLLCTYNHTDGCGWFYEFKDKKDYWAGPEHKYYLGKAQNIIRRCEHDGMKVEDAIAIFKMVKER